MARFSVVTCDRCNREGRTPYGDSDNPPGWGVISFQRAKLPQTDGRYVTSDSLRFVDTRVMVWQHSGNAFLCADCIGDALRFLADYVGQEASKAADDFGAEATKTKLERDWFRDRCAALEYIRQAAEGRAELTGYVPKLEDALAQFRVFDEEQRKRTGGSP